MKTRIITFLFALIGAITASANSVLYDFEENGLRYQDLGYNRAEIVGYNGSIVRNTTLNIGPMTHNGRAYSVVSIADYAFEDCGMTGLVIRDVEIASIGHYAFRGCDNLQTADIDPTVPCTLGQQLFDASPVFREVKLGSNITKLSSYAFLDCAALTTVELPAAMTELGYGAFRGCTALQHITLPSKLTTIKEKCFANSGLLDIVIPDQVSVIPTDAFKGTPLSEITLGRSVTRIKDGALEVTHKGRISIFNRSNEEITFERDALINPMKVDFYTGVKHIRTYMNLAPICLANIQPIDDKCTFDVGSLRYRFTGTRSAGEQSAYKDAECSLVKANSRAGYTIVNVPGLLNVDGALFHVTALENSCCARLDVEQLNINAPVSVIDASAFLQCTAKSIKFASNSNLKKLPFSCFIACTNLVNVDLTPLKALESVEPNAFHQCTSLESVKLPASVKKIGFTAFPANLKHIYLQGSVPPEIVETTFDNYNATLHVPSDALETYFRTPIWKNFNHIGSLTSDDWTLTYDDIVYRVINHSTVAVADVRKMGHVAIPAMVEVTDRFFNVVAIDATAFQGKSVTHVTIPSTVKSIDARSFQGCNQLEQVTIGAVEYVGDYAFAGCESLQRVDFQGANTTMGRGLFAGCWSLQTVTLPSALTNIEDETFDNCWNLSSVAVPASVTSIGTSAFRKCQALDYIDLSHVAEVGNSAFAYCDALYNVSVTNVTTFGDEAFTGCTAITGLAFVHAKKIGARAFANCSRLQTTNLYYTTLVSIGDEAFSGCPTKEVKLPSSVKYLGAAAFKGCTKLTQLTIDTDAPLLGETFSGCNALATVINNGTAPQEATATDFSTYGTLRVVYAAYPDFKSAPVWRNFKIEPMISDPSTLWQENGLWYHSSNDNCYVIASLGNPYTGDIVIPASVTHNGRTFTVKGIEAGAFAESDITSVKLGANITGIGDRAFAGCSQLATITCEASTPATIGESAFDAETYATAVLFVPQIATDTYMNHKDWGRFAALQIAAGSGFVYDGLLFFANGENCTLVGDANGKTNVIIPSYAVGPTGVSYKVTEIGQGAFRFRNVETVFIPETVTKVGEIAFLDTPLTNVYCAATTAPTLGTNCFPQNSMVLWRPWNSNYTVWESKYFNESSDINFEDVYFSGGFIFQVTSPTTCRIATNRSDGWFIAYDRASLEQGDDIYNLTVTGMTSGALANSTNLAEVSLPNTLTHISEGAFRGCKGMNELVVPDGVTRIDPYAFQNADVFQLTLPATLRHIGKEVFNGCTTLRNIYSMATVPPTLETAMASNVTVYVPAASVDAYKAAPNWKTAKIEALQTYTVDGCLYMKNGNMTVALVEASSASEVVIPENIYVSYTVTEISPGAFRSPFVETVMIPATVTSIDAGAFSHTRIQNVYNFSETAQPIGEGTFSNYGKLYVKTPSFFQNEPCWCNFDIHTLDFVVDDVTYTMMSAKTAKVKKAPNRAEVNIPAEVTFNGYKLAVTEIGNSAFEDNTALTKLTLPTTLLTIGSSAFSNCTALPEPVIPEGVRTIGSSAFSNGNYTTVRIPSTVQTIGSSAFRSTKNVTNIYCYVAEPPVITTTTFRYSRAADVRLHVTDENYEKYHTANVWKNFTISNLGEVFTIDGIEYEITSCNTCRVFNGWRVERPVINIPENAEYQGTVYTVTAVRDQAFSGSPATAIHLPATITELGMLAFNSCDHLETFDMPSSVRRVGMKTFANCTSLRSITLSSILNGISESMFAGCSALVEAELPGTSIGRSAFENCTNLLSLRLSTTTYSIADYAFKGCDKLNRMYYGGADNCSFSTDALTGFVPGNCLLYADAKYIPALKANANWKKFIIVEGAEALRKLSDPVISVSGNVVNFRLAQSEDAAHEVAFHYTATRVLAADETIEFAEGAACKASLPLRPMAETQKYLITVYATCDGYTDSRKTSAVVELDSDNVLEGDMDGNGSITIGDMTQLIQYLKENPSEATPAEHEYVDLGLPSGTLWATCNVGAASPQDNGIYFAWGEIAGKEEYSYATNKWCNAEPYSSQDGWKGYFKYTTDDGQDGSWYQNGVFVGDGKAVLDPEDDAATQNWGDDWCMPTKAQLEELASACTWTKVLSELNEYGSYTELGYTVKGPNGNSIYLPAAGSISWLGHDTGAPYYWSRNIDGQWCDFATSLHCNNLYGPKVHRSYRYLGLPVRAVRK